MRIKHILVTSFNRWLRPGTTFTKALDDNWLRYRWKIFNQFTVASVAAQTYTDFDWVILFHQFSPTWLRKRTEDLTLPCRVRVSFDPVDAMLEDLRDLSFDVILTTRIDSDDAWHRCAMARIRESFEADPYSQEILNFDVGYQYDSLSGRLAVIRLPSPPFCTKVNLPPFTDPLDTGGPHHLLRRKYLCRFISRGDPMFAVVIHKANIQSRVNPALAFLPRPLSLYILREAFHVHDSLPERTDT